MGLSLVEGAGSPPEPAAEPVTLAEVKQFCDIDSTDRDGQIAGHILAARRYCENVTKRAFVTQHWNYTLDYDWPMRCGVHQIDVPKPPLQSVASITYVDSDGNSQTLSSSDYVVHTDRTAGGVIVPAFNVSWPAVRYQIGAITVKFAAGWAVPDVPDEIRNAIMLHVKILYDLDPVQRETLESARDSLLDHYIVRRL